MKYLIGFILINLFSFNQLFAQKTFGTRNAKISFISPTDEDVKATNNEVSARLAENGQLTFNLLVKGFKFAYAEMQDHFNNEYLESNRFPRADYKGQITNIQAVNFKKDGVYPITVNGSLTIHGVTKPILTKGKISIKSGIPNLTGEFILLMKDFKIDASSVTEKVKVTLSCQYQ